MLARWLRRRHPAPAPRYDDDGTLVTVGEAFDAARADSAVLAEMAGRGADVAAPVLVRHHLRLPADAVQAVTDTVAEEGYVVSEPQPGDPGGAGDVVVRASRTQVLTALGAAQERSRMAGLAQRVGGEALGWDALAPAAASDHLDEKRSP